MGHCTYGSLQHLQTSEHCPYPYIALQLQSQDGQSATQLATLQWLPQLFRQQLPAPKTWCVPCRNAHPQGECPFKIVSHALEHNYDNPTHPARNFFYHTYHDHFPKHCMICNADNHSTLYCPHDNMRFELSCRYSRPFSSPNRKGFVPPGRWSSDEGNT